MCPACEKKDELIRQLTQRVIAQSEILRRNAERNMPKPSYDPQKPPLGSDSHVAAYIDCMRRGVVHG